MGRSEVSRRHFRKCNKCTSEPPSRRVRIGTSCLSIAMCCLQKAMKNNARPVFRLDKKSNDAVCRVFCLVRARIHARARAKSIPDAKIWSRKNAPINSYYMAIATKMARIMNRITPRTVIIPPGEMIWETIPHSQK